MNNKLMMTSVSTVALVAGGAQQGLAQDGAFPAGYMLNVQGAYGTLNNPYADKISGGPSEIEEKFGDSSSDAGYIGSVSLARQIAPGRDMSLGLTIGGNPDNDIVVTDEDGSGFVGTFVRSNDLSFAALDFEMGHTKSMPGADVRFFYGARGLSTNAETEKLGEVTSGGILDEAYSQRVESEFAGVGPRVGMGYTTKLPGQFGLSGEVGLAWLFGDREDTSTETFDNGGGASSFSSGFSERQNVTSLDAQVGVDYYVSPTAKISAGYQLQQLWNIDAPSDTDSRDSDQRIIHGAFVGFTTTF